MKKLNSSIGGEEAGFWDILPGARKSDEKSAAK